MWQRLTFSCFRWHSCSSSGPNDWHKVNAQKPVQVIVESRRVFWHDCITFSLQALPAKTYLQKISFLVTLLSLSLPLLAFCRFLSLSLNWTVVAVSVVGRWHGLIVLDEDAAIFVKLLHTADSIDVLLLEEIQVNSMLLLPSVHRFRLNWTMLYMRHDKQG